MTKKRSLLLAGVALASWMVWGGGAAFPAGINQGYPVIGGQSYCQVYANGVCTQTIPAGPGITGLETSPSDTGLANGANPQTGAFPLYALSNPGGKNWARGGEFALNLWQRGTTFTAITPTTYQMVADGWFAVSASNTMTITKQTPATTAADFINPSLPSLMRVARPSGTPSGLSCVGTILDVKASQGLVGKNAVLRFHGYAPSTFSAANEAIQVSVAYYTAGDSTTAGTNTATFALSASGQSGGITGYQAAVAGFSGQVVGGSVTSGVATIPLTASPVVYAVYAPIPTVNSSGTAVTGVGYSFCATPTATTTVTTDYFEIEGVQIQGEPSTTGSPIMPNGVTTYTGYDLPLQSDEKAREYAYAYLLTEANTGEFLQDIPVLCSASGAALITVPLPNMREAPSFTLTTAGGWKIQTAVAQTAVGTTTLVGAGTQSAELTSAAACTSTLPYQLVATGTTGVWTFSAEP